MGVSLTKKARLIARAFVAVVLSATALFCFGVKTASAAGNPELSFEGKIVTAAGVNIPDGNYAMEFKIYTGCTNNTGTGCTAVWTEDYTGGGQLVSFSSGVYQVNLGSITAFGSSVPWDTSPLYLSLQIGGTSTCTPAGNFLSNCGGDGVMTPYILLTSTPYAQDSALLGGLSASQFGQLATNQTWTGTNAIQATSSSAFVVQNNGGSGTYFSVDTSGGNVNLGATGSAALASTVNLATSSSASNIQAANIGSNGDTSNTLTLDAGTGASAIQIGNSATNHGIQIGTGNGVESLTLGSTNSTSVATIHGGTGGTTAITLNTGAGGGTTISSTQPAASSGSGTSASTVLTVNGAAGGNTTGSTGQVAGVGGGIVLQGGNGGTAGSGATNGNGGTITLSAGAAGAGAGTAGTAGTVIVKNQSNSVNGFQVQNTVGAAVLQVDTTSTDSAGAVVNYLSYPGFETGSFSNASAGWATVSPATLSQNTNRLHTYSGLESAQVTTTSSNGGLTTSSFTATPPTGTYIISFYAAVSSGTMASTAFTVQTTDGATHTCSPASGTTINSTGFQRLFCSITTTGNMTALQITQNDSTARTIYIDSVQLQSSTFAGGTIAAPTPYQMGAVMLRGALQGPISLIPETDSTSVFQIYNAAGTKQELVVDSLNSRITIGSGSVGEANPVLLVLDSGTSASDPTEVDGATYYNASLKAFRCGINGAWTNCVNGQVAEIDGVGSNGTISMVASQVYVDPLYIPGPMTVNSLLVDITVGAAGAGDVGLYNSSGTLLLNGGTSSVNTGSATVQTIAPTQTGSARVLPAGQYYTAVTGNAAATIEDRSHANAGLYRYCGLIAGVGGTVLPSTITLSNVVSSAGCADVALNN